GRPCAPPSRRGARSAAVSSVASAGAGASRARTAAAAAATRVAVRWGGAREAIETAHRRMDAGRATVRTWYVADAVGPASADTVATINAYLVMRDHIVSRMKRIDRELTFGQLAGETQVELARRHGITQSAVSQRLERSGGSALLATVDLTGGSPR